MGYVAGYPFSPETAYRAREEGVELLRAHCPVASAVLARQLSEADRRERGGAGGEAPGAARRAGGHVARRRFAGQELRDHLEKRRAEFWDYMDRYL